MPAVAQECGELFLVHILLNVTAMLPQDHTRRPTAFATIVKRYILANIVRYSWLNKALSSINVSCFPTNRFSFYVF